MTYKAGIITLSDKGAEGKRYDESGDVICEILTRHGFETVKRVLIPDDGEALVHELIQMADQLSLHLILTTGGTGFSERDITPETTLTVLDKEVPGISEAIRAYSMTITKRAMLSRGVAGIRGKSLIVNLPGSPKAVRESLSYIITELPHGIDILNGISGECARK